MAVVAGCASPAERLDATASALGLRRIVVDGDGFGHVVFVKGASSGDTLRIYVDGDGSPYVRKTIAPDPTPRRSLVLDLLRTDPGPAVYLGRPCYHGETGTSACTPAYWTTKRYGQRIVNSMAAAAAHLIAERRVSHVTWIGHSGGGTLAMLIAPSIPQSDAVVTVAANLNVAEWARVARQDLSGSLDPATAPPLSDAICQYHYAGSEDAVVPATITASGLHGANGRLTIIDGFDHVCCWAEIWPQILARLNATSSRDHSAEAR